ncbi:MAG: GIY-YIG nuclease family protein [Acidobacteria bacterium]|nr:MAG: GIY-YIG nuclease family protein [Acidobacteriota bacterium]
MWFVYILCCADDSLYIGATNDVASRVAKHNEGTGAAHTAKHRPVRLVYTEGYANRLDCLERERQLKRWTRAKEQALIAGDNATLKSL